MAKLIKINGEQTILGSSVVNACRVSAAPAGKTYLNINAYKNARTWHNLERDRNGCKE
ncbi:MAG: hypothetical protein FWC26_00775 [Fibromonadales bacterium]|nr:hypothetical protein [Fibromonadales bacterium]